MISEYQFYQLRDGENLHVKICERGAPLWLIVTHGIGEHLERHQYWEELIGSDYNLFFYDLRAHGRSSGDRSFVKSFNAFYHDLQEIIDYLRSRYRMERYALFGHSMGALITAGWVQELADKEFYPERIILSSPPVGYYGALGKIVSTLPRKFWNQLAGLPFSTKLGGLVDIENLSHLAIVAEDYKNDPLCAQTLHTNLVLGMVHASKQVFSKPLRPECPAYVSVGTQDKIVDPAALLRYFSLVEKAFNVNPFEGAYHEIHNEIEKYREPYFQYLKKVMHECRYPEES